MIRKHSCTEVCTCQMGLFINSCSSGFQTELASDKYFTLSTLSGGVSKNVTGTM